MESPLAEGQIFVQERCLLDHCWLLDAPVEAVQDRGKTLRLRNSTETMPKCSTINKQPNTEKSRLKKKSISLNHVPCNAEESLHCTLCFPCSHSSVLLTHQYNKAKEANKYFPGSPKSNELGWPN